MSMHIFTHENKFLRKSFSNLDLIAPYRKKQVSKHSNHIIPNHYLSS